MSQNSRLGKSPATLLRAYVSLLLLASCGAWGCHSGPSAAELQALIQAEELAAELPMRTVAVQIVERAVRGNPPEYAFRITGQEALTHDIYTPAPLSAIAQELKYDPKKYREAKGQARALREPERGQVLAREPRTELPAIVYRRLAAQGATFTWTGKLIVTKDESGWLIADFDAEFPPQFSKGEAFTRDELPPDAVTIDDLEPPNVVTIALRAEQEYVTAVAAAQQAMEARLAQEAAELRATCQKSTVYEFVAPMADSPSAVVAAQFIAWNDKSGLAQVLLVDPADRRRRAIWSGHLVLPPPATAPRSAQAGDASRDGWELVLRRERGAEGFPIRGSTAELRLQYAASGGLHCRGPNWNVVWKEAAFSSEWPTTAELRARLEAGTKPGAVWEGTLHYAQSTAKRVRLVFTERRAETAYLRAACELAEDPFTVAVFEGQIPLESSALHTSPLELARVDNFGPLASTDRPKTRVPLFVREAGLPPKIVIQSLDANEWLGTTSGLVFPANELRLKPASPIADFVGAQERWRTALAQGAVWSGPVRFGGDPAIALVATVAAANEDLSSLTIVLQDTDNPHHFTLLAGAVAVDDHSVDGYALRLDRQNTSPQTIPRGSQSDWGVLFGRDATHPFRARLALDGRTLYWMSPAEELVALTPVDTSTAAFPTAEAFTALWKQAVSSGVVWKGTLKNIAVAETASVELQFPAASDALGNVNAMITLTGPRRLRIPWRGVLRTESTGCFGFALQLQKQAKGEGPSAIFGGQSDIDLHLRLSPDGKQLIGMAGKGEWTEFLELMSAGTQNQPPRAE